MYMYYIVIDLLWSIIKLGKVTLPLLSPSLSFILPPSHRNASFTYILFLPSHPWVPPWPPPSPHRTPLGQTIKLGLWSQTCFNFHIGEIKGMVHIAQAQLGKWQFEAGAMFYLLCCGCSVLPEFSFLPSQPRSVTLAAWFVFFSAGPVGFCQRNFPLCCFGVTFWTPCFLSLQLQRRQRLAHT